MRCIAALLQGRRGRELRLLCEQGSPYDKTLNELGLMQGDGEVTVIYRRNAVEAATPNELPERSNMDARLGVKVNNTDLIQEGAFAMPSTSDGDHFRGPIQWLAFKGMLFQVALPWKELPFRIQWQASTPKPLAVAVSLETIILPAVRAVGNQAFDSPGWRSRLFQQAPRSRCWAHASFHLQRKLLRFQGAKGSRFSCETNFTQTRPCACILQQTSSQ